MGARRHERHPGGGFTLIETLVAVSVSGILLLSLGSVVVLASRAIPTGQETVITAGQIERGIALLQADIEEAIDIQTTNNTVLVGVPDRNADGVGEAVRYWLDDSNRIVRSQNGSNELALFGAVKTITITAEKAGGRVNAVRIDLVMDAVPPRRNIRVRMLNSPAER